MTKGFYSILSFLRIPIKLIRVEIIFISFFFLMDYSDEKKIERAKITEPYGYVIKPFKEIDLRTSIEIDLYKFKKEKEKLAGIESSSFKNTSIYAEYIYLKSNSKLVKVQISNIYFLEALKDHVIIHTDKERFIIHST